MLESEAGIGAGAVEDELVTCDGESRVFAGAGQCGGGFSGLLFAFAFRLGFAAAVSLYCDQPGLSFGVASAATGLVSLPVA